MNISIAVWVSLAIAGIVFLITWLNGPQVVLGFKRFERRYLERVHRELDSIYSRTSPKRFFYIHMAVLGSVFTLVSMTVGIFNGLLFSVLVGVVPWAMLSRAKRIRTARFEEMLPDSLISLASSLRAGLTLPQAMGILVDNIGPPISEEFGLLLKEHRLGLTLDESMNNMGERVRSKNLDLVITSIQVARVAGGNMPQVFDDTATAIREITRLESKIATMTSQGKMQAWVLGSLPVGMGAIIYRIDPTMIAPLWEEPLGWIILFFITIMEIVGIFMIRKIVAVDV
jgi:tight adherence protein B